MARKSQRLSAFTTTTPRHKRASSSTALLSAEAKTKKPKVTPTKSQYFEDPDDGEDTGDVEPDDGEESTASDEAASEFGVENEPSISASDADDDDEYESNSDEAPKKRKKSTPAKSASVTVRSKEEDLWRPGVKTGLGPGTQVVIKKVKARPAGKTPYQDETIHPNTLMFLEELKANNDRQWLKMHDAEFRQSEQDWYSLVAKLTERLIEIDDTIPELPVKDVVFRIYRDIRFSKDPTPYKVSNGRIGHLPPRLQPSRELTHNTASPISLLHGMYLPKIIPYAQR
ncbi:hypothetical protein LTR37_010960 [Vermiconidia calcicola]|uniref:Uncharacterized protein n=1 Tax=Vermiconidia calcicola TaxID=1690605 RepID=A0ACC3N566_9PEZI|nr:hypothetical protein LTR37_010960 [Vermiconidia calcicola]